MFWIWKDKIAELTAKISAEERKIEQKKQSVQALVSHGKRYAAEIPNFFAPQFLDSSKALDKMLAAQKNLPCVRGWQEAFWKTWVPEDSLLEELIRIGEHTESRSQNWDAGFSIPHYVPFIGHDSTIIIVSDDRTAEAAIALLQSLAIRIALLLPHQARYTLLDPVGNGAAFPMQRHLPLVRETGDDIRRDLDQVSRDIQRIIATYLDAESDSFELLPEDIRVNERLEFILAANFPKRYDRRAIEALQSISSTGPKAGKYTLIHYNKSQEMPTVLCQSRFRCGALAVLSFSKSSFCSFGEGALSGR
ncbi:MAG: hypothetical protein AAFY72_16050, partial [Cyanobacteria bacterium J06649_4]